jgi:UTP--glucose-1-phosphate uridylyltransferase
VSGLAVGKAVIPCAGWGTRLLPATKAIPKVMTSVVDRPVVQWAVEEAAAAGMGAVCLVVSGSMPSVEEHFGPATELSGVLESKGKTAELKAIHAVTGGADVTFARQTEARGLGHAVGQAEAFLDGEAFAVLLPDVVVDPGAGLMAALIEAHRRTGGSVLALVEVPREQVSSYGVVAVDESGSEGDLLKVASLVEKPSPEEAPSNLSVAGRYVLTPGVVEALRHATPGAGGEIQLTDAIAAVLAAGEPVHGLVYRGRMYDTGSVAGLIEANMALALGDPAVAPAVSEALRRLGE